MIYWVDIVSYAFMESLVLDFTIEDTKQNYSYLSTHNISEAITHTFN